jgi:hypothetical protein
MCAGTAADNCDTAPRWIETSERVANNSAPNALICRFRKRGKTRENLHDARL